MTLARACWLSITIGCSSPSPSPEVLTGLVARASHCADIRAHIYAPDGSPAAQMVAATVACMNDALSAKTAAYTTTTSMETAQGCDYSWWFVTDNGLVRMFHTDIGYACDPVEVVEDQGCAGPFFADATKLWAIQARGCAVFVP